MPFHPIIDLRSDTVTQPTKAMQEFMMQAQVGDDVFQEDPTANELEKLAAKITGQEAALFLSSGTQSNLIALLSQCERGEEYITGQQAHIYKYEAGGAAVLGGIQPQPIEIEPNGELALSRIASFIKEDNFHFAKTKLVSIENTICGNALTVDYVKQLKKFTQEKKLKLHIDGARIFNATVKYQTDIKEYSKIADSISCCLSKGLGAPIGTVLCSNQETIQKARRWRKMLGGGMRQIGFIAAAGIYALQNHIERLIFDHQRAEYLAQSLQLNPLFHINYNPSISTNMVLIDCPEIDIHHFQHYLSHHQIKILIKNPLRLVLHLGISDADVEKVISVFNKYSQEKVH